MSLESAVVAFVVQKLGDALIQEATLLTGLKSQIQSLKRELELMYGYLKDVDERLEEGNEILRLQIRETRRISFNIEDVIDFYILQGVKRRRKGRLKRFVSCLNYFVHTHKIAIEIEAIKTRIKESAEMFRRYPARQRASPIQRGRPRSYPDRNNDHVVGFEDDTAMLLEKLTTANDQTSILCIVGMGGSGKTALARKLYDHPNIKRHFNKCRAWVFVSQEWNTDKILVEILRQVTRHEKKKDEIGSIEGLRDELREYLGQTSSLIVLDDVWKEESLHDLLPAIIDIKRSRIIITTRNREVVQFPNLPCFFHEPPRLNLRQSSELFKRIAFPEWVNGVPVNLLTQMLEKCDGLPLAIVALGGILHGKEDPLEWKRVSDAVSARVIEARGECDYGPVKNMLALSYQKLPYYLKPCFLYFALFPEDYVIRVGMLKRMWVAEGFVTLQQRREGETLEEVAGRFIDELVERYVIQVEMRNYAGRIERVRIHGLMRDLCIEEGKEQEFLEIITSDSSAATTQEVDGATTQSRRVSICPSSGASSINIPDQTQNSNVQSAFVFNNHYEESLAPARVSLKTMHKNFLLLKVLIIHEASFCDVALPDEIGNLSLLRHLEFSAISDCKFPKSMGNLCNLLTFDFTDYSGSRCILPNVFWKMKKLRHLYLRNSSRVPEEGFKLETLKNLQTLWGVVGGDWMLKEMPILSQTVTKIRICDISSEEQLDTVFQCPSVNSGVLKTLDLQWNNRTYLQPQNLELLCRCCFRLRELCLVG